MVYTKTENGWWKCLPGSIIHELTIQGPVGKIIFFRVIKNAPASVLQGGATRRQADAS